MCDLSLRNDQWLQDIFTNTYSSYFADIKRVNGIRIEFGRRAKRRLGSISVNPRDPSTSVIRINGWFRHQCIPEEVVTSVIVHELCHYAHGFNSGSKEPQHKYPHAGGVIRKEFAERGLESLYELQDKWIKIDWPKFLDKYHFQGLSQPRHKKTAYRRNLLSKLMIQ